MLIVGISGQTGSGKSLVADELRKSGATVISGDDIGRQVVTEDRQVLTALVRTFGSQILTKGKALNRRKLAEIAFSSPENTQKLNAIVHPRLLQKLRNIIRSSRRRDQSKMLVVDAALIYNWGLERELDYVIVVESRRKNQLLRLKAQGVSETEIRHRTQRQIPKYVQRRKADFVITNNGTKEQLAVKVAKLIAKLNRLQQRTGR